MQNAYDIDIDIDRVNQPADRASRVNIFNERNGNLIKGIFFKMNLRPVFSNFRDPLGNVGFTKSTTPLASTSAKLKSFPVETVGFQA